MSWSPWIWMYLNEQFPMVCLGCLENKYFSRHLIFHVGWIYTKPSGNTSIKTRVILSFYNVSCSLSDTWFAEKRKNIFFTGPTNTFFHF